MADTLTTIDTSALHISSALGVYAKAYSAASTDYSTLLAVPNDEANPAESAHAQLTGLGYALLGATTVDGSEFKESKTRTKHFVHQQRQPVAVTEDEAQATFTTTLHEFNEDAILNAFGGGTIEVTAEGNLHYLPPENGQLFYVSIVLDSLYNTEITRVLMERCTTGGETTLPFNPKQLSGLQVTADALSPKNHARAWELIAPGSTGGS